MKNQIVSRVNAFAQDGFTGNPAGVCLLEHPIADDRMQWIAAKMNLSETAFLVPVRENAFHLRWFTPSTEVALCGHATLASAAWLWKSGAARADSPIEFDTLSGILSARKEGDRIIMDFPSKPAVFTPLFDSLLHDLGLSALFTGRSHFDLLVVVKTEREVRNFQPDLAKISASGVRGLILTARSDNDSYDFVSRFFAPGAGVDEDPVTGSAHCTLGPYWMTVLAKNPVVGLQASERGGVVNVRVHGDRVDLSGQADFDGSFVVENDQLIKTED